MTKINQKLSNYIVNIEDNHSFNLEISKDAIDFLILILNKESLHLSNANGIIYQTLGITLDEYAENNVDKSFFADAKRDIAKFFKIFISVDEFDNAFYKFLIEDNTKSDAIKKQKISKIITGIEMYIDYLWKFDSVSIIDFHYKNSLVSFNKKEEHKTIHEILANNNILFYDIPTYWIYINLKTLYDFLWSDYSSFIDNQTRKFNYFYSNKEDTKKNNEKKTLSRETIFNYLFRSPKDQEIFEKYEVVLIKDLFLNDEKNKWLRDAASLIRFYNYCENKKLFEVRHDGYSTGVKLLRKLYNFFEGTDLDTPSKRKKQENKRNKHQFTFLNIKTNFK